MTSHVLCAGKNTGIPHHTIDQIDGIDYQILLEADYLVNADESNYSSANIRNMKEKLFRTQTGTALLEAMYSKTRRP